MTQNVLTVSDFDKLLDGYFGRQVSHTSITQSTSNITGQETLTKGTPANIKATFTRTNQNYDYAKAGFFEKGDAVMLSKYADGVKKNDMITVEGNKFRVKEAYNVVGVFDSTGSDTSYVYTSCNLFLIE